jgi:hypothetical protein
MENKETTEPQTEATTAVAKYSITDQKITEMKAYLALTIKDVNDKEGLEKVHKARMEVTKTLTGVEAERKELKKKVLETGRKIDSEAERISAELEPVKKDLKSKEDEHEKQLEEIRATKRREEEQKLGARSRLLLDSGMMFDGENYSLNHLTIGMFQLRNKIDEEFSSFVALVREEHEAELVKQAERKAEEERLLAIKREEDAKEEARLAEIKRLEDERIQKMLDDAEARKKEQEEERRRLDAIDAEQKARAQKLQEEEERLRKAEYDRKRERARGRHSVLISMGLEATTILDKYHLRGAGSVSFGDVLEMDEESWEKKMHVIEEEVLLEKAKIQREKDEEANKAAEIALLKKKEEERLADEERQRQLELAPDREKLQKYHDDIFKVLLEKPELKTAKANATLEDVRKDVLGSLQRISNMIKKL